MDLQKTSNIKSLQSKIEKALAAIDFNAEPVELYEPISYTLAIGGKRIRPLLVLLGCELFGGDIEKAINPALGIELFHNFTLVHDDIMDKAPFRRNKPSVHNKWDNNVALLSGDVMQVLAYRYLCKCDESKLPAILDVFNQTAIHVCEGQQFDMNFEKRDEVSIAEYIDMISLKTAALLAGSLMIGSILGEANEKEANLIHAFGKNTGIAFQLQDDILDVFGNPEKFGKIAGGDIIANKKTYPLLKAFELADTNTKTQLEKLMKNDMAEKVEKVKAIYTRLNVQKAAQEEIKKYFTLGIEKLGMIDIEESHKQSLLSFSSQLMAREI